MKLNEYIECYDGICELKWHPTKPAQVDTTVGKRVKELAMTGIGLLNACLERNLPNDQRTMTLLTV
jgi:hypothetical protein